MKLVMIASKNPVKIKSVEKGFQLMFPNQEFKFEGLNASSDVADQPMGDDETFQGAVNRVNNLAKISEADFWVGLEAGIEKHRTDLGVFGWVVVKSKKGKVGKGKSGVFMLPEKITQLVEKGMELGEADDQVTGNVNTKQKNGTVGRMTGDVIDRTEMYVTAVVFALIPFKNPNWY